LRVAKRNTSRALRSGDKSAGKKVMDALWGGLYDRNQTAARRCDTDATRQWQRARAAQSDARAIVEEHVT